MHPALNEPASEILSVTGRTWRFRPHDARDALALSQQYGLPEIMGRILASRGIAPDKAESFLKPTLRDLLPDPFHLKDMDKAAARVAAAIKNKEQIAIWGDYDVDGATSSALLMRYFRALGLEPLVHIPDRIKEGYGPNTAGLLALKERGASLVITVDCGTMSFEPLIAAQAAGLEVIVIDHHKSDTQLPVTAALVNPNRYDESSPHTHLAAVGMTFLLCVAVNQLLKKDSVATPDLLQFLDLVALGTICDVVSLTGINRALVTQGLKVMRGRANKGIAALMDVAKLDETPNAYHAGYVIGPRINAGGRVGKSDLGVRILTTEDDLEARALAEELNRFNAERKAIESLVQDEAFAMAEALPTTDAVIMVAKQGWHPGVIGIVAGRLKDAFNKPTAVIALDHGIGKASARSITGIDLGAAVVGAVHEGLLVGGGGHAMAAGFTVEESKIPALRDFFNSRLAKHQDLLGQLRPLSLDGVISINGLTLDLVKLLDQAAPFGAGNASVRLMLSNLYVAKADVMGECHVRAIVSDGSPGGGSLRIVAFRCTDTPIGQTLLTAKGKRLHFAGQAKINSWNGRESVDFIVDDVALA